MRGGAGIWMRLGTRWLPFADAATAELPLGRLMRLGLFQLSVGATTALLAGTLNRVMIVELAVPASLVALMVALPVAAAPFRALLGHRSDVHRSPLGWRRVPYIWFGTLVQFGGLAIMPFALILLSGDTRGSVASARALAALAFLLAGAGMHAVQTAGLALATDLVPARARPRAVALLHLMLLLGLVAGSLALGLLLAPFSQLRLIQVVQGAAVVIAALNLVALWKQEPRSAPVRAAPADAPPSLRVAWRALARVPGTVRLLAGVALGTAAFGMQDVLLEPYGGQVLGLGVAATSSLTALTAAGAIGALWLAARALQRGADPVRVAAVGAVVGVGAFAAVIFASPLASPALFRAGAVGIGIGGGLFAVGTLTTVKRVRDEAHHGLALGAWGAVQATCAGAALAAGGVVRDAVAGLARGGRLGEAMAGASVPYSVVYHIEIGLLFAALVALGPLVAPARNAGAGERRAGQAFGLADLPG
ncbi:MAG: BCD family MFS transporter [Gemmatirosa sp.]